MSTPSPRFRIGRYDILRLVGKGGMAHVWLGRDRVTDRLAAVKVVPQVMADTDFDERLRQELRALAGLDHPLIAATLDAGHVTATDAEGDPSLMAGSPWFAMEYVPHGDLLSLPVPAPWPVLAPVLADVLDALAHAHARGVIHRDLKPTNVLLRVERGAVRAVLADFGIAQVLDAEPDADTGVVGTPAFMAPEQITRHWHEIGPPTDLYAVGCLAYALAAGQWLFDGPTPVSIVMHHLSTPPPRLPDAATVPVGFQAWLDRLLAKRPDDRYPCAAEALRALARIAPIPPPDGAAMAPVLAGLAARAPTMEDDETRVDPTPMHPTLAAIGLMKTDVKAPAVVVRPLDEPAIAPPVDWRNPEGERRAYEAAGPGLFGVRALPMIGRDAACDALWAGLRAVAEGGGPRGFLVEGARGAGKTRLGQWLTWRAAELGVAWTLAGGHGAVADLADGLAGAVRRWFRPGLLGRAEIAEHVTTALERLAPDVSGTTRHDVATGLLSLIADGTAERLDQRDVQLSAMVRWLQWLARRRPVILWLDDAHWRGASLEGIERLVAEVQGRMLVVATVRSDAMADRGREMAALTRLRRSPRIARIALEPMSAAGIRALLTDAVGLSTSLAAGLAKASDGSPLFALQTIADWLEGDALVPGVDGLTSSGRVASIPLSGAALARRRLDRAVAPLPDPEAGWRALEAGAALGDAVQGSVWTTLSPLASSTRQALLAAIFDAGLARPAEHGWSFAHGFVRDALVERARAGGRWPDLNRAIAEAIRDPDPHDPRPCERRARAWEEAGETDEAMDAWVEAAGRALASGAYRLAAGLTARAERLAERAGLEPDAPIRVRCLSMMAEAQRFAGTLDEARATLDRLRALDVRPDRPWAMAEAARLEGQLAFFGETPDEAFRRYDEAIALFERIDDTSGLVRSLHGQGWAVAAMGRFDAADERFRRGLELADAAGLAGDAAWCQQGVAGVAVFGARPEAEAEARACRVRFEAIDSQAGYGYARLLQAELAWAHGRSDAARRHLDAALSTWRTAESNLLADGLMRLALLDWQCGHVATALDGFAQLTAGFADRLPRGRRAEPWLGLARCHLARGALEPAADAFDRAVEISRQTAFPSPAVRDLADDLAAAFLEAGDHARAAGALRYAARLWKGYDPYASSARMSRAEALAPLGR